MRKNPTPAEKKFWDMARRKQIFGLKFNRQFIIEHANIMGKKFFYIADFHCFDKKLIIELDGEIHSNTATYDRLREEVLKEMGYQILRLKNIQVMSHWDEVLREIYQYV
jgi:leucyl-tRNA synthetase